MPFQYNIQVNNEAGQNRLAMVRIFMGPKVDERGQQFLFRDQRGLMVEMDKFVANCEFISVASTELY
jgi:tyrosinase